MSVDEPVYEVSYKFRNILVPVSPGGRSKDAISVALDMAQRYGSRIVFLYVAPSSDSHVEEMRETIRKAVGRSGVQYTFKFRELREDETVASEIVKELSEGEYDLVIMSTRGYYGTTAFLYHSISMSVAIAANTSVLILR